MAAVVGKSISMVLPASMQQNFLEEVSQEGDELKEIILDSSIAIPAASLVQRYQLSLDLAILRLTRLRRPATLPTCFAILYIFSLFHGLGS